jgi:UDP-2,4-diacetamido-2,4,6-trideoxy-beta-L-altropyranose hydrolase
MLIAFRADASPAAGGGHVMRCLALAEELRSRACEIVFLCTPETSILLPSLRRAGHPVIPVNSDPDAFPGAFAAAGRGRADAMVIDSYALPASYESAARRHADLIAVIDDGADRCHDCDLLLDQTFGRRPSEFADVVPRHAVVLTGSQYVLLRPEFLKLRPSALVRRQRDTPVRRILVSMGMTDVGGLSLPICEAIAAANTACAIDVVLGSAPARAPLQRSIRLHVDPPSMAQLMAEADIAIGAAGTTTWERCCLGLPSVLIALAPNQHEIAENVAQAGAALHVQSSTPAAIADACRTLISDSGLRGVMASKAAEICDGLGAGRVADALLGMRQVLS